MEELYRDIGAFNEVINKLNTDVNESKTNFSIIPAVEKILGQISNLVNQQKQLPLTLNREIFQFLNNVDIELKKRLSNKDINEISKKILTIQNLLGPEVTQLEQNPSKIGYTLAILLNTDEPDFNSAILKQAKNFLMQNFPFITTRSVIMAQENFNGENSITQKMEFENVLLTNQSEWDLYELTDGSEIVLFLPKKLLPEKQGAEKLKALDFVSDSKEIRRVAPEEIFRSKDGAKTVDSLIKFFDKNPKVNKIFDITGHGDASHVGSLEKGNYKKFLSFIEQQKCKCLVITSCEAGGRSSLLNMPPKAQDDRFIEDKRGHPFLTIVRSLGDFPVTTEQTAETDNWQFFGELSQFIEVKDQTNQSLRKVFVYSKAQRVNNELLQPQYAKSYFPHSSNIPGGFRGIGEKENGISLTYHFCKLYELAEQKPFSNISSLPFIKIENKNYIETYPLIINATIVFHIRNPILISMTPGKAHHFFNHIIPFETPLHTPLKFLKETAELQARSISVTKAFFIQKLDSDSPYHEVAILIAPKKYFFVAKLNAGYQLFTSNDKNQLLGKDITSLQHALFCLTASELTKSSDEALRSTTGGLESEAMFSEVFHKSKFFSNKPSSEEAILNLLIDFKDGNVEKILKLVSNLKEEEKKSIVFYLLEIKKNEIALKIIEQEKIDPNSKNVMGTSLISAALQNNDDSLIDYLINKKVDLNVHDPFNHLKTPLHQMVAIGKENLITRVINNPEINLDINALDSFKLSPLFYALDNPANFKILAHRSDLNFGAFTVLSSLIYNNRHHKKDITSQINTLIEAKIDPNKGNPSAFILAIESRDSVLIKKLIDAGATPFERDQGGSVPFIQAILKSSPEVIELLLKHPQCDLSVLDARGMNPLLAALYTENQHLLAILEQKNINIPPSLSQQGMECLDIALKRLNLRRDDNGFDQLLKFKKTPHPELDSLLINLQIKENPDRLAEWIIKGHLNPNCEVNIGQNKLMSFFEFIASQQRNQFEKYKNLILVSLEHGAGVGRSLGSVTSPVVQAASSKQWELVKMIMENAKDLSDLNDPKRLLDEIITSKDFELIKLACQKLTSFKIDVRKLHPLDQASQNLTTDSSSEIFIWLFEQGHGDLNTIHGKAKTTPFYNVVKSGNFLLVEYCLGKNAEINLADSRLLNPLETASSLKNDPEGKIFKLLVNSGGDLNAIRSGTSPFATLVSSAKWDLIEWALSKGAKINDPDFKGRHTPLMNAIGRRDAPRIFEELIKAGGNIDEDNEIEPLLSQAIFTGDVELVKFCLSKGAKLENEEAQDGAFLRAILSGKTEMVQFLRDKQFKFDSKILNSSLTLEGYERGGIAMLKKTFDYDPSLKLSPNIKAKLWRIVIEHNDREAIDLLLNKPDFRDPALLNEDLLLLIIDNDLADLFEIFSKHPAIAQNSDALFSQALTSKNRPRLRIIEKLLKLGCKPEQAIIINKSRKTTPIYISVENNHIELVKLLLKAGIKKSIFTKDSASQNSALDLAEKNMSAEILNLLKGH